MMDLTTGDFQMLEGDRAAVLDFQPPAGQVVVRATEDEMRILSRRVRAGAKVETDRKSRRKRQKQSRRQNR